MKYREIISLFERIFYFSDTGIQTVLQIRIYDELFIYFSKAD